MPPLAQAIHPCPRDLRARACVILLLISGGLLAGPAPAADLLVCAAASLTDSLHEIGGDFQKQTAHRVRFNLGASSFLARQIEEGAPADLYFAADEASMDRLEQRGLLVPNSRRDRLSNALVIVVPKTDAVVIQRAADLTEPRVRRIALADPRSVPAGIYARQYLEKAGLWSRIAPKMVSTDNVRAALGAVESGNVEAGIVYRTDARISAKIRVAVEIAPAEGPVIRYPMALLRSSSQQGAARQFLEYLASPAAGAVFARHSFIVLPPPEPGPGAP